MGGLAVFERPRSAGERRSRIGATGINSAPCRSQGQGSRPAIGEVIRSLRETAKWSQAKLATESGISGPSVSRIENGQVDPSWGTLRQLALPLNVSLETLAHMEEEIEQVKGSD